MKVAFLLLAALLGLAVGYCPNDCSAPNGVCSSAEVCLCEEGWAGDDCSIADEQLRNHVEADGHVDSRQWKYFHIYANSQQASLELSINQTSTSGDLDAYVRLDKYPTRQEYDMRDITTSRHMKFEVPSPSGVYYVGVYGFMGGDFTVMATLKTNCPNDCSGHGSCNFDGTCSCRAGWASADCSQNVPVVNDGDSIEGEVASREWKFYRLAVDKNTIDLELTVGEEEDADLYVKIGELPELAKWDFRDTGVALDSHLTISSAQPGDYYIGVYGFTETSQYTLNIRTFSECPNKCSGESHGTCSETFDCACNEGYEGDNCEDRTTALVLDGTTDAGHVGGNVWNYYRFNTFTTSNVVLSLVQTNEGADCDVYVKEGEKPSRFDFDYRDVSYAETVTINLQNPSLDTYHIGVYGYKACDYEISAEVTLSCPNDCSGEAHGTCVHGHCICKEDWMSEDCSLKSESLENGVMKEDAITTGEWKYFHFNAVPGSVITIALHEVESVGNVWMFESAAGNPSLTVFDHADTETNTAVHRIAAYVDEDMRVNIGVYGSILASPNVNYPFRIVAWQASFCDCDENCGEEEAK